MHERNERGMDVMNSPLLAKVARGTQLPVRDKRTASITEVSPLYTMGSINSSESLDHTSPDSDERAGLSTYDSVETSRDTSNYIIAEPLTPSISVEARYEHHGVEPQNNAERREEQPSKAVDNSFDPADRFTIGEHHKKIELMSGGSETDPGRRETKEKELIKSLAMQQTSIRPNSDKNEWSIREGFIIETRDPGGTPEEKSYSTNRVQDVQPVHEQELSTERQSIGLKDNGFPERRDHDVETGNEKTLLIKSQAGAPGESRLPLWQGRDFRQGNENMKREKRDTNDALKVIFPQENRVQEKSRTPLADGKGKYSDDPGKGKTIKSDNNDIPKLAITQGQHINTQPIDKNDHGTAPHLQENRKESKKTAPIVEPSHHGQDERSPISLSLDAGGPTLNKPVLRDAYPSRNREVLRKQPSARQHGTVKIGNIHINIKGRNKTENEVVWPEAPSYVDHAIAEDWEWSCRYGR